MHGGRGEIVARWLVFTVVAGLIPALARLIVWLVVDGDFVAAFAQGDWIVFGLVLHISASNEIQRVKGDDSWKMVNVGIAVFFIFTYGVLLAADIVCRSWSAINVNKLLLTSFLMSVVSLVLTWGVYYRISKRGYGD